jgi:hypothetical protein
VTIAGKDGFIDQTGGVVIKAQFDHAWGFSCGLGMVEVDHKRGYIDKSGKLVIGPQFDMAMPFSEDLAYANLNGKKGYIDTAGKMVTHFDIGEGAGFFSEGMAEVQIGKKWGYIDKTGKIVIPPKFDYAYCFSGGFAAVGRSQHYGFIDHAGEMVIGPRYSRSLGCDGLKFSEGLTVVQIDDKCGFIDRTDRVVVHTEFEPLTLISSFSEGMAKFQMADPAKWGYMDKSGTIAITPRFDYVTDFSMPDKSSSLYQCHAR